MRLVFLVVFALAVGFAHAGAARADTVIVFAAASVKNALDEIVTGYEAATGHRIRVSYAASSALARQIENGAPADLFISADQAWMDHLQGKGLIRPNARIDLVRNRLVLVSPADTPTRLGISKGFALAAALGDARLAMADPASVPAGRYAKAALESLGVWNDVARRIAAAPDVRAALMLVARGETPFGIVYASDARVEPRVRIVDAFPEATHPPIVYPAALTARSKSAAAAGLLAALNRKPARAVFEKYGFR